jgi:predicted Zn-dependent protease with MMP-like domain
MMTAIIGILTDHRSPFPVYNARIPNRRNPMPRLSDHEFREIVRQTMESLPAEFRSFLDNVVVEVADWPDDDLLRRAGFTDEEIEDGETLLGFFDPLELPTAWSGDAVDTNAMLHRLWIFREPHVEEFPDPKRLRTEVRKTVIHELAHHFGWTDRDLERFDDNPDPFGREE